MKGFRRAGTALVAVAIAAVTISACGSGDDDSSTSASTGAATAAATTSADKSPIVVGATLGLTGPLSFYDVPFLDGTKAAIADFNAKGGIMGRQIELVTNDNASDVSKIPGKAQEMIAKKPTLLLTSNSDTTGIPAARVAQQQGQLVMGASGPTTYGSQIGPLVYNDWHGDPTEAAVATEFLQEKGWDKVITVEDQVLGYTKDICNLFRQSFEKANPGGVVADIKYNSGTAQSYPSQVSDIRAAAPKAKAIVLCGLVTGSPALIKGLRGAGVDLPIFGMGGGLDGDYWTKSVPKLGEFYSDSVGAINPDGGSTYADNPNEKQKELLTRIEEKTGKPPVVGHVYTGYSAIEMLAEAIKRAGGKTDSESLSKALDSFRDVPTLVGNTTYTPDCHVPKGRALAITQIVNGKGKYVSTITPKPENVPAAPC